MSKKNKSVSTPSINLVSGGVVVATSQPTEQKTMIVFTLEKISKAKNTRPESAIYHVDGLAGSIRIPKSYLADGAEYPQTWRSIEDLPLAKVTPRESKEEKKARLAKMSAADKHAMKLEAARKRLKALEEAAVPTDETTEETASL